MNQERWQKIKGLLDEALKLDAHKREQFLDNACGSDKALRRELEELLASSEKVEGFLENPPVGEVAEVIINQRDKLMSGQSSGNYKILGKIGAGGMSEVYLAEDMRLHRRVALKVLPENIASNKERLLRFEREAYAASALNHPNILTIFEFGEAGGVHFIATEYIEGKTLREKIIAAELTFSDALDIAQQTAFALSAAHGAKIIHRDLKPENIMMRADGIVKILDFGLAKVTENKEKNPDAEAQSRTLIKTNPGVVMGTVAYMSPEQARGKEMDERTDIWSLGCVIYEMLTGRQPFAADTMNETIALILTKEPKPLSDYEIEIPAELRRIIGKMMQKKPDERYQTAKDLLVDLRQLKKRLEIDAEIERTSASNLKETRGQIVNTGKRDSVSSAEYITGEIKQHKRGFVIALAILLITTIGAGYWFYSTRSALTDAEQIESIAVMPFVNSGDNADMEYLSDGMTESLITSLSQLPKLSVKARNSVFRYKGKEVEPRKVGAELSVQAILLGRVVQRGQDLTLYVELVDADTENTLWKADYNRPMTNLVSLQNEIARDVSQKLQARISNADAQKVAKSYTANPEAFQLYLRGRFHLNKQNEEGYKKSLEYFQQAVLLDPKYALAYTGIADSYYLAADWYLSNKEAMEKAKTATVKALEIDDTLPEAHYSMGTINVFYDWNWSEGEKELKNALELNPNYADTRLTYGFYLGVVSGRKSEALEQTKQALQSDPLSLLGNGALGVLLMDARRFDEAIEQFYKTLELDPDFWWAHQWLGETYVRKGQFPEAIAQLQKARKSDSNPQILGKLGRTYALSGNKAEAQKLIDELKILSNQRYVSSIFIAEIYAAMGERDAAFEWLEKGYEERSIGILFLRNDPLWDNFRSDPRFQDLLRRINFPK